MQPTVPGRASAFDDRDQLLKHEPDAFFTTDHYRNCPTVLIRLARVSEQALREILADAWRHGAPRRLLREQDERHRT